MISIKGDATIVGISELRTKINQIIEECKKNKVLIGKRNKPLAVLVSMERFNQMEKTLDTLEDYALGLLAKERDSQAKKNDYIDIDKFRNKMEAS